MTVTFYGVLGCLAVGVAWWLVAALMCLPFRCRLRPWLRWLRPTLGLPLLLGSLLEAWRSRGYRTRGGWSGDGTSGVRVTGHPYRGFAPFIWGLGCALGLGLAAGIVLRWVARASG